MSDTTLDILRARAERICEGGCRLLKDFSGMHPANTPNDSVVLISPSGDQFWNDLPSGGKQIQAGLLPEIDRFSELIRTLIQNLPGTAQQNIISALESIRNAIEQDGTTWWKTKAEAVEGFRESINQILAILENYSTTAANIFLAIPDTNALLANPDIEHWRFDDARHFTILLTPTVLSELDKHKINHKNEQVRDKATTLIRKIKEYRRRGSIHDGVPIVTDLISLRFIAKEPGMSQTLSWFDSENADDRFLATALEVMRENMGSVVFIATSDINMQNKAEMAGIPFREVPLKV